MALLDEFRRNSHAAALMNELSWTYKFVQESNGRVARVSSSGGVCVYAYNLDDLERIAASHRNERRHGNGHSNAQAGTASSTQNPWAQRSASPRPAILDEQIAALEKDNARLRERGRAALKQRDHWQARAEAAEARLAERQASRENDRYAALKKLIAKELHPDHVQTDGLEKLLREALFKKIWPAIERLDRGEA